MFENISEIILKVTRDCNLRCTYCYVKDKDQYIGERMSFPVFQKLIKQVISDKNKVGIPAENIKLNIVFHGGEPTLLGKTEIIKFVNYARQQIPRVGFGMQTNLTNIDEAWAKLLAENNISPGISIDGCTEEDNKFRSKEYALLDKLKILKKYAVHCGPLMILSSNNIKKFMKNYKKLKKTFGIRNIKANYVENTLVNKFALPEVSAKAMYANFFIPLMKLFLRKAEVIENNLAFTIEQYVQKIAFTKNNNIKTNPASNCLVKFCACGNNLVEVDAEGNVCTCGRWSDVNKVNLLGNLNTGHADFFGLASYQKILELHLAKIKDIRQKQCDLCLAADICSYGCLAFAYDKFGGQIKIREELVCRYFKPVKEFFIKNRYPIIYNYVRSKGWEIVQDKNHYYLNIVSAIEGHVPREIFDKNLQWAMLPENKWYLKMPKKSAKAKIAWE